MTRPRPRTGEHSQDLGYAGFYSFNGNSEMTR